MKTWNETKSPLESKGSPCGVPEQALDAKCISVSTPDVAETVGDNSLQVIKLTHDIAKAVKADDAVISDPDFMLRADATPHKISLGKKKHGIVTLAP